MAQGATNPSCRIDKGPPLIFTSSNLPARYLAMVACNRPTPEQIQPDDTMTDGVTNPSGPTPTTTEATTEPTGGDEYGGCLYFPRGASHGDPTSV